MTYRFHIAITTPPADLPPAKFYPSVWMAVDAARMAAGWNPVDTDFMDVLSCEQQAHPLLLESLGPGVGWELEVEQHRWCCGTIGVFRDSNGHIQFFVAG